MLTALDSRSSGLGMSAGRGHCVMFLGNTFNYHSASFHPEVSMDTGDKILGSNPRWTSIPCRGVRSKALSAKLLVLEKLGCAPALWASLALMRR